MKKILAISGGIDSMVMLHMFKDDLDVVIAHFNHGTRPSSDLDENFCRRSSAVYRCPFYSQKVTLGAYASEEKARSARYDFLNQLAKDLNGEIYTAHHQDDLIESIAINFIRGTGWRGLTPLSFHHHPFLDRPDPLSKKDILTYAAKHQITYRQDPTNTEDHYLRNRLRQTLYTGSDPVYKEKMFSLWTKQKNIRQQIDALSTEILGQNTKIFEKSLFTSTPPKVATELLYQALKINKISLTRPRLADFLTAINTYQSHKKFNLPADRLATITKTTVII